MIDVILRDLRQPEYIHVLINPLPVYGLAMGLLGLIVAFFLRSRPAQIATLIIVLTARLRRGQSMNSVNKRRTACFRWKTKLATPGWKNTKTAPRI